MNNTTDQLEAISDDYNITIQTIMANHDWKLALSIRRKDTSLTDILRKNTIKPKLNTKLRSIENSTNKSTNI